MSEQIAIHILNADVQKVKKAITRGLNKSISTKDLVSKIERVHNTLSTVFGESNDSTNTDELLNVFNKLNEKEESFPKSIEDFVIVDNNGVCSVYSNLFTVDNISKITERVFGKTKLDLVFVASLDNSLFVASLYEEGYLNGQLVVGKYNQLWGKKDNLCLDYFEEKFNIEKGTFNALVSKADVQYAKKKFAELTNLSVDFQSDTDSVTDPDKH